MIEARKWMKSLTEGDGNKALTVREKIMQDSWYWVKVKSRLVGRVKAEEEFERGCCY